MPMYLPRQDLHTHNEWDDGKSAIADMVKSARRAGLTSLGVCVHAPMPYGIQDCPQKELSMCPQNKLADFLAEIRAVQKTCLPHENQKSIAELELESEKRMDEAYRAYEEGRIPLSELNREMDLYSRAGNRISDEAPGLRLYAGVEWDVLSTIPQES